MASTIKVTNIDTPDGTGNIIVDRPLSGSGASLTSLPAANLTGTLPAISGASLTNLPAPDDNSITLAKMAGGTDGNIITYDASGDPAYVTTGTSGHVLTSGGTGVAPTFQAAAGGGKLLQMIATTAAFTVTTITSSSNNTWVDTSVVIAFTPLSSTSRFMVTYGIGIGFTNTTGDGGYAIRIKRVQSSTTVYPDGLRDWSAANLHSRVYCSGGQTSNMPLHSFETFTGHDQVSHNTDAIVYTIQGGHYNAESLLMGNHYNTRPHMVVLEVEVV
jgi:hypothetical protein